MTGPAFRALLARMQTNSSLRTPTTATLFPLAVEGCRRSVRGELQRLDFSRHKPAVLEDRDDIRRAWMAARCINCHGCSEAWTAALWTARIEEAAAPAKTT